MPCLQVGARMHGMGELCMGYMLCRAGALCMGYMLCRAGKRPIVWHGGPDIRLMGTC